jgi:hypothetical protein
MGRSAIARQPSALDDNRAVSRALPIIAVIAFVGCGAGTDATDEPAHLSTEASRYFESTFAGVGATRSQADCATDALASDLGMEDLEEIAGQAKRGNAAPSREIQSELAEAASQCEVTGPEPAEIPDRCLRGNPNLDRFTGNGPCALKPD